MSNFVIRYAVLEDTEALADLAVEFSKEYGLPYDRDSITVTTNTVLNQGFCILITDGDVICGGLAAMVAPSIFNLGLLQANEVVFFVYPKYRGTNIGTQLLDSYEKVARERGCTYVTLVAPEALKKEKLDILYRRKKFKEFETTYLKRI